MLDIFSGTGAPATPDGFTSVVQTICSAPTDEASLWALLSVETRGFGYLPDRRPKILFERHIFHARTGGVFSQSNSDISNPESGGYLGGAAEYQRLKRAMVLNRVAALESASWGLGQVMGFNASAIGYSSVDAMVDAFKESEDKQLDGCAAFITAKPALAAAFKAHDWPRVAFFYNGKNFAAKGYDKKLQSEFQSFNPMTRPDVSIRAGQAYLSYIGFDPKRVDGKMGENTASAIKAFQRSRGKPETGAFDAQLLRDLKAAAGL